MTATHTNTDTRLDALEDDLRQAERYIRGLYWFLISVVFLLSTPIVILALFVTGYLPR